MADFLTNPIDICFGSMPTKSIAPAAYLVIESIAATSCQQVKPDMLTETYPPTHSDLIAGFNRVESMLSDTIKICDNIKRSSRPTASSAHMPYGLRKSTRVASDHEKKKILIQYGSIITSSQAMACGSRRGPLDDSCPSTRRQSTWLTSAVC
jgi:hypothetical protein